jgi:hypothetical protein
MLTHPEVNDGIKFDKPTYEEIETIMNEESRKKRETEVIKAKKEGKERKSHLPYAASLQVIQ